MHGNKYINDIEKSYSEDEKFAISLPDTKELKNKITDGSIVINNKHIYDNNGNIIILQKKKNTVRKGN